jgi:hypothetical protein
VRIDPIGALTGTYTVTASTAVSAAITLNGAAVTPALTRSAQDARYALAGTAGQIWNLGIDGAGYPAADIAILKPDGTVLSNTTSINGRNDLDLAPLAASGRYTVVVNPLTTAGGRYTLTLSTAISQALAFDAAGAVYTITREAQDIQGSFPDVANQLLTVTVQTTAGVPVRKVFFRCPMLNAF